jgi:phage/plasmid-like protein (TIGR03299 family)
MFSGRGIVPWHKLGTIVDGTLTSGEAIEKAGLNWEVVKHPIFARIPTGKHEDGSPSGIMKRVDSLYATVRSDNNHPLGIVGKGYTPIQNADGFEVLDSLTQNGAARFDTAGALGLGETVWMLMLAESDLKIAGDIVKPYFLATTSHDGSSRLRVRNVATRVVCQNTLGQAMGEKVAREVAISHTKNAKAKMADAAKILGLMHDSNLALVATSDQLLAKKFSRADFEKLVARIMPPPEPGDPTTTDRMAKNWTEKFESIMKTYGAPDLENVRDTAWGAFNAIADFEQHALRTKGTEQERLETLFKRSFLQPTLSRDAFAILTEAK